MSAIWVRDDYTFLTKYLDLDLSAIAMSTLFVTRYVDSILAITFDASLQMTRDPDHSKALVETHLFRRVLSQSGHFPKIEFLGKNGPERPGYRG